MSGFSRDAHGITTGREPLDADNIDRKPRPHDPVTLTDTERRLTEMLGELSPRFIARQPVSS